MNIFVIILICIGILFGIFSLLTIGYGIGYKKATKTMKEVIRDSSKNDLLNYQNWLKKYFKE